MRYKLTATITHKSFDAPLTKEFFYSGNTKDDILAQIETLPHHIKNLANYGKTAFKDTNGVKHKWILERCEALN